MARALEYEDMFNVTGIDERGKKFDKVTRIMAKSHTSDVDLTLDINSHIFSLPLNERFTFALKTTLHKDGSPDTGEYEQGKFDSHADDFHYVMCGKIFRRRKEGGNLFVYMSCGGLLCCLNTTAGSSASLDDDIFSINRRVYLLLRSRT